MPVRSSEIHSRLFRMNEKNGDGLLFIFWRFILSLKKKFGVKGNGKCFLNVPKEKEMFLGRFSLSGDFGFASHTSVADYSFNNGWR